MIYTCYSYKGGVGRSMALANIAELLYARGLRVLMIDFDLEAPGLEQYFYKKNDPLLELVVSQRGIIDLLQSYKNLRSLPPPPQEEAVSGTTADVDSPSTGNLPADETFPYSVEPLQNFIWEIHSRSSQNPGELLLMPAGRRKREIQGTDGTLTFEDDFATYADHVRSFGWDDFYINWDGEHFFNSFYEKVIKRAEIVLIDSRTGVAEMSGVCTYQLADVVVMFVAPNNQNIDGTKKIAASLVKRDDLIRKRYKQRKLSVIFVPSRVDSSEKEKVDDLARRFREIASRLASPELTFEADTFTDLTIPYIPYYSFVEELVARDTVSPAAINLKKAYENICRTFAQFDPKISERMKDEVIDPSRINVAEQQDRLAEHAIAKFDPDDQQIARSILTRLVRVALPEEGERKDTPKDIKLGDLSSSQTFVARRLEEEKLVVLAKDAAGQEIVGLADEGFIQNWSRFRKWIDEDREFLIWRLKLQTSALEWEKSGGDPAYLLLSSKYLEALRWYASHKKELNSFESNYIEASTAYYIQVTRTRRKQERFRYVQIAATVLAVAATVVLIYVFLFKDKTTTEETRSRQIASISTGILSSQPELSALLAIEASRVAPTTEAQKALRSAALELRLQTVISVGAPVYSARFSHDGKRIVTGSGGDGSLAQIWQQPERARWQNLIILRGHKGAVRAAAFSPDDQLVATASDDGSVIIWASNSGTMIGSPLLGGPGSLTDIDWSPDGRLVAASARDNHVYVWDLNSRKLLLTLKFFRDNVNSVCFSQDPLLLAAGSSDSQVCVWKGSTMEAQLVGHIRPVLSVRFSSDGKFLVTAGEDNTARIWEVSGWRTVAVLSAHTAPVTRASFNYNRSLVVTASQDTTAILWETATSNRRAVLRGPFGFVNDASFSSDGQIILTANEGGTACLWETNPSIAPDTAAGELASAACSRLTRNMTAEEWRQYMGNEAYRATCPAIPLPSTPTPAATSSPVLLQTPPRAQQAK